MAELPLESDPKTTDVKAGWKSTEAWLTLIAQVLGALMYSGLLSGDDPTEAKILKIGGVALAILSALGYQAQRGWVKTNAVKGATIVAVEEAKAASPETLIKLASSLGVAMGKEKPADPPPPSS